MKHIFTFVKVSQMCIKSVAESHGLKHLSIFFSKVKVYLKSYIHIWSTEVLINSLILSWNILGPLVQSNII